MHSVERHLIFDGFINQLCYLEYALCDLHGHCLLLLEGGYAAELVLHLLGDDGDGVHRRHHVPAVQRVHGHVVHQVPRYRHNGVRPAQLQDDLGHPE